MGVGPVGLEQLRLDAVERTLHRGVAERSEQPVEQAGAVEAGGEVDPPVGVVVGGLGFDSVGFGELAPVGGGAGEAGPVQRAGVVDQHRLAVTEGLGELGPVEGCEPVGVMRRDRAGGQRVSRGWHRAEASGEPDLAPGGVARQATVPPEPGRGRPRPVGRPHPPGIERGGQPGLDRGQLRLGAVQRDQRGGEGVVVEFVGVDGQRLAGPRLQQREHVFESSVRPRAFHTLSAPFGGLA